MSLKEPNLQSFCFAMFQALVSCETQLIGALTKTHPENQLLTQSFPHISVGLLFLIPASSKIKPRT